MFGTHFYNEGLEDLLLVLVNCSIILLYKQNQVRVQLIKG